MTRTKTIAQLRELATPNRSALHDLARREADHRVTVRQIGRMTLMRMGARDFVHDDRNGELWFRVGAGNPHRKVSVVLRADDTYAIEIGKLKRRTFEWVTEATAGVDQGIYGDMIGEVIDRLFVEVAG
jgi:hypothetical protein